MTCTPYFLPPIPFARNTENERATPSECYSCANYSGSSILKCAVNPERTSDQECNDFEVKASDWDSSEDNPANYSDWDNNEDNAANYADWDSGAPIQPMIHSAVNQGYPMVLLPEDFAHPVQENPPYTPAT
jgi:hypothetical protein